MHADDISRTPLFSFAVLGMLDAFASSLFGCLYRKHTKCWKLKSVCVPYLQVSSLTAKSLLLLNSIVYERLVLNPYDGFFFHRTYPKLAKENCLIQIWKQNKDVLDCINNDLNAGLILAQDRIGQKQGLITFAS